MKFESCAKNSNLLVPFFLSTVSAGFPSPAEEHIENLLDLNALLVSHPAATFFVRVSGDSMREAHIYPGDVLVVNRALKPKDQDIVIAILEGEFTVKRLVFKEKKILLVPENPLYPIREVKQEDEFQVWGVVTYVIHKT